MLSMEKSVSVIPETPEVSLTLKYWAALPSSEKRFLSVPVIHAWTLRAFISAYKADRLSASR